MSEIEKLYELTTNCSQLTDKEIINADGTRNWQANILLDNVKRLEAENSDLKQQLAEIGKTWGEILQMRKEKEDWMLECAEKDNDIEILVSENAKLKEEKIKLTEEVGNLIIRRNTVENNLRDTESRLIDLNRANVHNLVLLQRALNTIQKIKIIAQNLYYQSIKDPVKREAATYEIIEKINGILEE